MDGSKSLQSLGLTPDCSLVVRKSNIPPEQRARILEKTKSVDVEMSKNGGPTTNGASSSSSSSSSSAANNGRSAVANALPPKSTLKTIEANATRAVNKVGLS